MDGPEFERNQIDETHERVPTEEMSSPDAGIEKPTFFGVDETRLEDMRKDELLAGDRVTPIDTLVERCKSSGVEPVKVGGSTFIAPKGSPDVHRDLINPDALVAAKGMSGEVQRVVVTAQLRKATRMSVR